MVTQAQLVDLIERGREDLMNFAQALSGQELLPGTPEHWSGRDNLAHIAEHAGRLADHLVGIRKGEAPPRVDDFNQTNLEIFNAYQTVAWEGILAKLETAFHDLILQVQQFSDAELNDAQRYTWLNGRPLWRYLAGVIYMHAIDHISQCYVERGDRPTADTLRDEEVERLAPLDHSPQWQSLLFYNRGCYFARTGEQLKALQRLDRAFDLNPQLADFSRQDTDLVSLHQHPDYLALVDLARSSLQNINPKLDRDCLIQTLGTVLTHASAKGPLPEYRLVGTGAALLHGVSLPAGDIDLLVLERPEVDFFAQALAGFRCLTAPAYLPEAQQYFAEYEVEGVRVGISTVECETSTDGVECSGCGPWEHFVNIPCGEYAVPAIALELRLGPELARWRKDRSGPILEHLKTHGCDLELVRCGLNAYHIPPAVQAEVLEQLEARPAATPA